MKSGICYPSFGRTIGWADRTATDPDYPLANIARLDEPRRVLRAAAAGAFELIAPFSSPHVVDFVALIHHNLPVGATVRVVLYSDFETYTHAYDTGDLPVWPNGTAPADFPRVRPIAIPAQNVEGIFIRIDNVGGTVVELGGIDVGRFWEWNVQVPRAIGVDSRSATTETAGVVHVTKQWAPRIVTGERELVSQDEVDTKFLDFQLDTGLSRAFVWCADIDDPSTWAREAMLVTNNALPAASSPEYDVGEMGFSFREHLR